MTRSNVNFVMRVPDRDPVETGLHLSVMASVAWHTFIIIKGYTGYHKMVISNAESS
jgi:hypothetical protein